MPNFPSWLGLVSKSSSVATIVAAESERENRGNKSSKRCQVAQVAIADKQKTTTTGDKLYTNYYHVPPGPVREGGEG